MYITIDGTRHEVKSICDTYYLPEITLGNGDEYVVAMSSEAAGRAARERWKDLAEDDPREFACLVGQETLVAWALGQYAGPGSTHAKSLDEWLGLWLDTPEEEWGRCDGSECEAHIEPGSALAEELDFEWDELEAGAGSCVAYLQNKGTR